MVNPLIFRIARKGGSKLLNKTVDRLAPKQQGKEAATPIKSSFTSMIAGAAITRFATRSVPGAIVVGGGLIAKALYDRQKARKAQSEAEAATDKIAESANGKPETDDGA